MSSARTSARPDVVTTARPLLAYAVLGALYLLAVGLLFANRVHEFADESDNLLGGLLIRRGYRLYGDYFSSHMPLPYFLAAIPAWFGAVQLEEFRIYTRVALIVATLGVVWCFRKRISPVVLGIWAVLAVLAHDVQWGAMLTAGTVAAYGVLVAALLIFTTPGLRFGPRGMLALSAAVFVAVQSELVAVYPLLVLAVGYLAVRWRDIRAVALLGVVVLLPHVLVFVAAWLGGVLPDFIYDAFEFNQAYYSQYLMNPSPLGILRDWQAQYRVFVVDSLRDPLGVEAVLIVANIFAVVLVSRRRGVLVGVLYYLFIALTHVRTSGMYYIASYFSLALIVTWAIDAFRSQERRLVPPAVLAAMIVGVFVVEVGSRYDLSANPPRVVPEVAAIDAHTAPGDTIFVGPYDPYLYLASERLPASTLPFYFPWQAIDPRSEGKLLDDLRVKKPPVIVFRRDELVNDRWSPRDYGPRLLAFIDDQYEPLDPTSPVLSTVFVRRDRAR